jgi:hypothetical protein
MAYSTPTQVKAVLLIDEATWDTEIANCVTSGDALIDSILAKHGLTVPTPVPQNIIDASTYFAAWKYRRSRDPVGAKAFEEEANRFLDIYIKSKKQIPFKKGEGT